MENDDRFTFLFNEQFEKIPWIFRFSKLRFKITRIVMIVCFAIALPLTTVFYSTGRGEMLPSALPTTTVGSYTPVMTYDYGWLVAAIVFAGVSVLIGVWIVVSKIFEKRAFAKATDLSNRIFLAERHRREVDWQNWKMQNRDY